MKNSPRRRWISVSNPRLQRALILRALVYWLYFPISVTCWAYLIRFLWGTPISISQYLHELAANFGPAILLSILLLPIVLFDMVRFSMRFVGPIFRLKVHLDTTAAGGHPFPLRFRSDDYWHELADSFNALAVRLRPEEKTLDAEEFSEAQEYQEVPSEVT